MKEQEVDRKLILDVGMAWLMDEKKEEEEEEEEEEILCQGNEGRGKIKYND